MMKMQGLKNFLCLLFEKQFFKLGVWVVVFQKIFNGLFGRRFARNNWAG
jgi:hypothetical protein